MTKQRVTVAQGDGIGPEITPAVLTILKAAQAPLEYDFIEVGEAVYLKGVLSGIPQDAWDTVRKNRILLKGPITTPQGKGYKSLNVTLRKALNLFANVRECEAYAPYVASHFPKMNMVIVRENEEDLYAGIEHRQTQEVYQTLKLVSSPGCERIIRYAFEYARAYHRKRVTCMSKDNIMKLTDGLFHRLFEQIAKEYSDIQTNHEIIDIGAARVAASPDRLDVVVTLNLYGDILSDIAAQVAGSVGLAGSANIGSEYAMFEAIHGSAPDIAGKDMANPSGLLQAAIQMLVHMGHAECAARIKNAWLCTLEQGIHTGDIYNPQTSTRKVGTVAFAEAVCSNLGKTPTKLRAASFQAHHVRVPVSSPPKQAKSLVGVDIFLSWDENSRNPEALGQRIQDIGSGTLKFKMITNRGIKVFPDGMPETFCTDHWRCRFGSTSPITYADILAVSSELHGRGLEIIKTENLLTFDGQPGYSLGQGE